MTMCPTGNPTDASGVFATADAPDGASPQATLGRLETMRRSQRMIRAIRPGIFPGEHACLFGGLLACSFQRLWYTVQWAGGVEELLILEVESLQREIFKECCFVNNHASACLVQ